MAMSRFVCWCVCCRCFCDERAKIQTLGVNVNELIVIAAKKWPVKRDPLYLPAYFYLGSYNSKTANGQIADGKLAQNGWHSSHTNHSFSRDFIIRQMRQDSRQRTESSNLHDDSFSSFRLPFSSSFHQSHYLYPCFQHLVPQC